jgi:hypothetical protein
MNFLLMFCVTMMPTGIVCSKSYHINEKECFKAKALMERDFEVKSSVCIKRKEI